MKVLKHLLWLVPLLIVVAIVTLLTYTAYARNSEAGYHASLARSLEVSSNDFQPAQEIPARFSCSGAGVSPHVTWTGAPTSTKSYVLIAMDWDAPSPSLRLFPIVHWVLYNIPKEVNEIPEAATSASLNERKIMAAKNIAGAAEYAPPCPPLGQHQYVFHVYALDVDQIQPASNDKAGVMKAMAGHVLGYGELIGVKSAGL
jgi:hypothetical protein